MPTSMTTRKDNLLMTTLIAASLAMATFGPMLSSPDARAVMNSADAMVQSVSTPTAMQPILYREAAIIVTAPRVKSVV